MSELAKTIAKLHLLRLANGEDNFNLIACFTKIKSISDYKLKNNLELDPEFIDFLFQKIHEVNDLINGKE